MSESNAQFIKIDDFIQMAAGFISEDIKIHNHFLNLSLNGVENAIIPLRLHRRIFQLVGIPKKDISEAIEEWYFKKMDTANFIDIETDLESLLQLSMEILNELNRICVHLRTGNNISTYKFKPR